MRQRRGPLMVCGDLALAWHWPRPDVLAVAERLAAGGGAVNGAELKLAAHCLSRKPGQGDRTRIDWGNEDHRPVVCFRGDRMQWRPA
jgi:hypothetical protein